jgi:hypothetical protein
MPPKRKLKTTTDNLPVSNGAPSPLAVVAPPPAAAPVANNQPVVQPPAAVCKKRTKYDELNVNQYLSEIQYYKIIGKGSQCLDVCNERGFQFQIAKAILEEGCWSANQFTKEMKVTRTECIHKLLEAKADVFTINFNKKPNADTHASILQHITFSDISDPVKLKKLSKELEKGEERTLIGHLVDAEPLLGRSKVVDLEEHFKNQERKEKNETLVTTLKQVDHRQINWMIINGIKYVVK